MTSVTESPPALTPIRHGRCRLSLRIDHTTYALRRQIGLARGSRAWSLTARDGPRPGATYVVTKHADEIACTCPDAINRASQCKHIRALVACGVLAPTRSLRSLPRYGRPAPAPEGGPA